MKGSHHMNLVTTAAAGAQPVHPPFWQDTPDPTPRHPFVLSISGSHPWLPLDPAGAILLSDSGEALLRGPQSRWAPVPSASLVIRISPLAWVRVIGMAAGDMADRVAPLPLPLASTTPDALRFLSRVAMPDQRDRAAEAWLAHHAIQIEPELVRMADLLDHKLADPDTLSVAQLCADLSLTQPRLSRLTLKLFGFRPKLLLRRARFLRTLTALDHRPSAQWRDFIDPSYVDQSHFIRDCHAFIGMAPSHYLAMMRQAEAIAA